MEAVDNTFSVQFSFYETCKSTYYLDVQSGVTSKHALLRKSIVKGAQLRYWFILASYKITFELKEDLNIFIY